MASRFNASLERQPLCPLVLRYANVDLMLRRQHFETENLCFLKQCRKEQADCVGRGKRALAIYL